MRRPSGSQEGPKSRREGEESIRRPGTQRGIGLAMGNVHHPTVRYLSNPVAFAETLFITVRIPLLPNRRRAVPTVVLSVSSEVCPTG